MVPGQVDPHESPTLRLDPANLTVRASTSRSARTTLMFGLSLATALPPAAIVPPSTVLRPQILPDADALLPQAALASALGPATTSVVAGRVGLASIDERLHGLESLLQVCQVQDGNQGLVCISVVWAAPGSAARGRITPTHLWDLTCTALVRHRIPHQREIDVGPDAILVVYGEVTAQVAWLDGNRLLTASATSLTRERAWAIQAARSTARLLARHRPRPHPETPWIAWHLR